jgi:predicted MFS family arabinose efflux permease
MLGPVTPFVAETQLQNFESILYTLNEWIDKMGNYHKGKKASYLFILSLTVSSIAITSSNGLINLLSIDIASTFQIEEGVAIQLRTFNCLGELILGLIMGFLVLRLRHKLLLKSGLIIVTLSAVGSYLAPTFLVFLLFSFIEGVGSIIVNIMAFTLIGDSFKLIPNTKIQAVSWIVASTFLFSFIGNPLTNFFTQFGGWRSVYLYLVLPISILGLALVLLCPSTKFDSARPLKKELSLEKIKKSFSKPVAACLIGWLFFAASSSVGILAIAFYRQHFSLSTDNAVLVMLAVSTVAFTGSFLVGRLGKTRIKSLTIVAITGTGLSTALLFLSPSLSLALVFNLFTAFFIGITNSAYNCLTLDQIPELQGTMLSFCRLFFSVGNIIFPALAGYLLVLFSPISVLVSYQVVGVVLGSAIVFGASILLAFAKEK